MSIFNRSKQSMKRFKLGVAAAMLFAVGSAAEATNLFYIQQNCGLGCSPITAEGVASPVPITPFSQNRTATDTLGNTRTELVDGDAGRGVAGASSNAFASVSQGANAAGPVTSTAAFVLQLPSPTGLPIGTEYTVALHGAVSGTIQTPFFPPQPCCAFSDANVVLAARSILTVNTNPQDFVPDLQRFGFAADWTDLGDFHSFGDGSAFGTGVFDSLGANDSFVLPFETPFITAHVGDTLTVGLGLFTAASVTASQVGFWGASASLMHTISFATDGPLFVLPDGLTLNTPDGLIVDNRFVPDGATAPVPTAVLEPSTLALFALTFPILGAFARRRRQTE
jgi:hypothetical protein